MMGLPGWLSAVLAALAVLGVFAAGVSFGAGWAITTIVNVLKHDGLSVSRWERAFEAYKKGKE